MAKCKIAIDITSFSDQYRDRGIGNYASNLVSELVKKSGVEWHLLGYESEKSLPE
jgi:hypothetical protein